MKVIISFIVPIFLLFTLLLSATGSTRDFSIRPAMVMLSEAKLNTADCVGEISDLLHAFGALNASQFDGMFDVSSGVDESATTIEKILGYVSGYFKMCVQFCNTLIPYAIECFNLAVDVFISIAKLFYNELKMIILLLNILFSFSADSGVYSV